MKKFLRISICAAFALACAISAVGCTPKTVPEHEHTFSEEWSHTADSHWHFCTYPGCNEHGDEQSHDGNWELVSTTKSPNCFSSGSGKYRCSVCGEEKTDAIPATGEHSWEATWHAETDRHYKKCTVKGCRAELSEEHNSSGLIVRTAAQAYKDGLKTAVCVDCGKELERVITPATGVVHSFNFAFELGQGFDQDEDEQPFFWFEETDEMYHIAVVLDDDVNGIQSFYNYKFTNVYASDGKTEVEPIMYLSGVSAGFIVDTMSISNSSNPLILYGPHKEGEIVQDGYNLNANKWAVMNEQFIRFRWYGERILRFKFVYSSTKVTSMLELVVNVLESKSAYSSWRSEWIAAHPDVERLSFVPSSAG